MPQDSAASGRKRAGTHSGRLLLRMPESLHADLAKASERAGVSLNGYINDALSSAVGGRAKPASAAQPPPRRPVLERLLVANLVVVAAVGVLVAVLLVEALH